MPAAPPDFRLYPSNALGVLAQALAETLRETDPEQSLLEPDLVLIPQPAMRRWLQATLAERYGVAANIAFLTPGEFVSRALDANVPGRGEDLEAETLRWRLYAALQEAALLSRPEMARIQAYLSDADPLKAWSLAGELGEAFNKYQAWRRHWLLRWEHGDAPDDPQAVLWRAVASGRMYRARRIGDYLSRFNGEGKPLPRGLPRRLFAFATLNVSPDVLRVIATQARVGTLHLYVPTPCRAYWGDVRTLAERLRDGDAWDDVGDNRLLQAWGAAGRDFMAVLAGEEVVQPTREVDLYADPEAQAQDDPANDRLLGRLQRDLLHRRGPTRLRDTVDRTDPSLQVHACHTPLRELQVLHDQLCALLDDPRFDPPLQPREIAVLAPDIDPYVPYLEAVFGGQAGAPRLPYTLADASPLASEPLAEVFLQLLALPVSRFGLGEVFDLLDSAPLAEAIGLEADARARLRTWLHDAGARWGLDAAHRRDWQAPEDEAGTWRFALDRLLLGHAADDETALLEGVAPWTALEGNALEALDRLLGLLKLLDRQRRVLGVPMSPAQWRERLLALLEGVFPEAPADAATRRTLDRLRKRIDAFAAQAEAAGYTGQVPPDVVRAHFHAQLSEAETRAPLLTGGISVGRMVPMRLLPFRVLCVLGMNDGQFPRRDPAAGLSRLTAELGTDARRPGDRSLREDDRYLFLQLFAAAQDVFYVSYQGADPGDGSAREPSVLVSELIEAAADVHADPGQARKTLVVRHPLQPFSPDAFGDAGEPRRLSYRCQWQEAAAQARQPRRPLPPWRGEALPMTEDAGSASASETLPLAALSRFLRDPADAFLRQRLDLKLDVLEVEEEDVELLSAPTHGLVRHALRQAVFEALLRGEDDAAIHAALCARGLLPSGPLGRRALKGVRDAIAPYAQAFALWRDAPAPQTAQALQVSAVIDGVPVQGRIADVYPRGIARLRFGKPSGPSTIRNGLDWLLASAAGLAVPLVAFEENKEDGIGPHVRPPLAPAQASAALRHLLAMRRAGLAAPLPFAPYSSWALFNASDVESGLKAAEKQWRGGYQGFAEGQAPALALAFRGRDPFADAASRIAFTETADAIFNLLTKGHVEADDAKEKRRDAAANYQSDFDAEDAT